MFRRQEVPKQGYPDCGSGRFSYQLTYKEWFEFNLAQRLHYNYLDNVSIIVFLLLVAGLEHPQKASLCGAVYIGSRFLYNTGSAMGRLDFGGLGYLSMVSMTLLMMFMAASTCLILINQ